MYAKASHAPKSSGNPSNSQQTTRKVVEFEDNRLAAIVYGQHDKNLARIEQRLGVVLINRGNRVAIEGSVDRADVARKVLNDLYRMAQSGQAVDVGEVDGAVRMMEGVEPVLCVDTTCLLYTSPSPRDRTRSRMPSSA
eukprot:TRINITY_DN3255_c0_g1_i1.p1 TRINITY_DN3255_c0_g1~~TRINITY_DN3255_c0_g1_i1.p1  ORF type:complete len:138 (-),score=39.85 TRINITY_DN3255_c0_g1_i1:119-532(-)